jgi:hypothetical protein
MKATLTFALPEESGEFRLAQRGADWALLVSEFDNTVLRSIDRGKAPCPWATGDEAVHAIRDQLYRMMADAGLSLEDLA